VQPRQMAVLAVVAAAAQPGITRDKVTGLLWPEIPDDAARHTLRDALYLLRGTLGEGTIEGNGGLLRINRNRLWTDVGAFRDAIAAGDLEATVEFYRGPFLDGFFPRHGVDFEHWVDATRKQLATQYEEALTSLAHTAAANGHHTDAVAWWRRLVAHDPPNTRFAMGLIKALAASGDPANAMLSLREHERTLRDEFGVPSPPELKALETTLGRESSTMVQVPDVVAARPGSPSQPAVAGKPSPRFRRWVAWVAAVAVLSLTAAWLLRSMAPGQTQYRSDLVIVTPFTNRTGDPELEIYSTLASDWIIHGIQQSGIADVVPALTVQRLWRDLASSENHADPVRFLARSTGASLIVHGAYYLIGDSIQFQADLADANLGSAGIYVESAVAFREDALAAVGQLRERVLGALAASIQPVGTAYKGLMTPPPNLAVYRAWREGEEAFSRAGAEALVANRVILPSPYPGLPASSAVWSSSGSVLTYLALEARAHGRSEAYHEWTERSIAWHREHIAEGANVDPMALVQALYYGGLWHEAEDYLETLSPSDSGNVEHLGFRAVLAVRLGAPDRAAVLDRELAALDSRELRGTNLLWRARIAALLGDKQRAVQLLHQARSNGWPFNIWLHVELDFAPLQDYAPFQEFLAPNG